MDDMDVIVNIKGMTSLNITVTCLGLDIRGWHGPE
jgi:hypothetical protein